MLEKKAIYYGQVELIPGIICDGYVLDDPNSTTVMSTLGVAELLSVHYRALQNIATKGIPKSLKPFWDQDMNIATNSILVVASNSNYKGRYVDVYSTKTIESFIRAYAFAFANSQLRDNQIHIGKRCILLMGSLFRTALDAAIKEACGIKPEIQKTAQKNYVDAVAAVQEWGFRCSVKNNIATKQDILEFLKVSEHSLNNFLRKHAKTIEPIPLSQEIIQGLGIKATRMNGYSLENAVKIILGMDTEMGIQIKRTLLGDAALLFSNSSKDEIQWKEIFDKVFEGLGLHHNYKIGRYRVDFFIEALNLCLECNGYSHVCYDPEYETTREKYIAERYALVRFHHQIAWQTLMNGILKAQPRTIQSLDAPSPIPMNCK